jgi:hypothetical protein
MSSSNSRSARLDLSDLERTVRHSRECSVVGRQVHLAPVRGDSRPMPPYTVTRSSGTGFANRTKSRVRGHDFIMTSSHRGVTLASADARLPSVTLRTAGLAAFVSLTAACGGRIDDVPEQGDASFEAGPSPYPVDCDASCSANYYLSEWLAPDGGADRCECVPFSYGRCTPLDTPTPPTCSCDICAGKTWTCTIDRYYGTPTQVTCTE